ncbi:MAG: hypothetical protein EKK61_04795 [Rickettsiales bacterium]|nr:MAG: hypothetical protein EKK61_04795 [Rickettsiales bacterium]
MINIEYKNFDFNSSNHQDAIIKAKKCSSQVRELINRNELKYNIFCIDNARAQILLFKKFVIEIKENYSDVIVIGMGGSVLNPKTLINLCQNNKLSKLKIHFLDNTDPIYLQQLLVNIELKNCAVVATSNSGQTIETNSLIGVMISLFKYHNIHDIGKRYYFLTNPNDGMLSRIGREINANIIDHTENISGRFSGLTNVSTFIASLVDVNVDEYINGARKKLDQFMNDDSDSSISSAAAIYGEQKPIMINLGYLQQFRSYLEWYSQIIAESLGKNKGGITPIHGLGPNDQHSMLQLYIEGSDDKLYSLFYIQKLESSLTVSSLKVFENLANKTLSDINSINFNATANALCVIKRPVRVITLRDLSPQTVGELVVHSMIETIILAHMMELNPFDQPGVQLIKDNTKSLSANSERSQ